MRRIVINCKIISPVSDICWNCLHFGGDNPSARRCRAFPNEIPLEIWEAKRNHDEPYPNDGGIRFRHFKSPSITSQDLIDEPKQNCEQAK
jgi:hypothetical protein